MSETVKRQWLEDKDGNKVAPRTLTSQITTDSGVLLEQKIQDDINEFAAINNLAFVKSENNDIITDTDYNLTTKDIADDVNTSNSKMVLSAKQGKVINERISNIIAHNNDTEGNTELVDIRMDVDGNTHDSAGDAVRSQISTLSSELKDIRVGANGVTYGSAGVAIRQQLSEHLGMRNKTNYDANNYRETGFVFCGTSENWVNVPEVNGGILMVFSRGSDSTTAIYQIFISYVGEMYYRNLRISGWSEWDNVINDKKNALNFNRKESEDLDIDNYTDTGFYFLSSGKAWVNTPLEAQKFEGGVLLVLDGDSNTKLYQLIIGYDRTLYLRRHGVSAFSEWVTFSADSKNKSSDAEKFYYIKKINDLEIAIYRKCVNGYIGYTYYHHIDTSINLDTWKLNRISLCDVNRAEISLISAYENEGVLKISGEEDYIGGIHGDERYTAFTFFVNGKEMTVDDIANGTWCEEIRFLVKSDIFHCDGGSKVFEKSKQTTFDKDGVHVKNRWKCLENVNLTHVRGGMFSIYKTVATKYYDSVVNPYPMDIPTTNGSIYDNNLIDTYYMGDVSVHVWVGERGGDSSKYSSCIQDFEDRLKTYFDCYDNHTTTVNEELYCQHSFNIIC